MPRPVFGLIVPYGRADAAEFDFLHWLVGHIYLRILGESYGAPSVERRIAGQGAIKATSVVQADTGGGNCSRDDGDKRKQRDRSLELPPGNFGRGDRSTFHLRLLPIAIR